MGGFKDHLPDSDYVGTYAGRRYGSRGPDTTFTSGGGGGRGEWADVSPHRRCPVCKSGSWCQVKRDGSVVLCKHIGSGGRTKENRDGITFHVHVLNGSDVHELARSFPPLPPSVVRAPADELDRAYRALFDALRLDSADRDALRARGLSDAAIRANGYASLPLEGRARFAREVIDAVGEPVARAVPGIVWKTSDEGRGRGWWSVGGWPGLLIPVRDLLGRIVAVKVRRREVEAGQQRYLYLTSSARGGASAENALHVPLAARARVADRLVITEGELKADVSTALLAGWVAVSLPGVGAWRLGADFAEAVGARVVAVAFDSDARTNRVVHRAQEDLVHALRARVPKVERWKWDARFKGLDDYLARPRDQETA